MRNHSRSRSRFGYGRSTFTCSTCDHLTRDTGDNGQCDLCPVCLDLSGMQNSFWDGCADDGMKRETRTLVAKLRKRGSNMDAVARHFKDIIAFAGT